MEKNKITLKRFLNYFNIFEFSIRTKTEKEIRLKKIESISNSAAHVVQMLQKAKRKLSKAYKSHRAGHMSIEEVFDIEWHVSELEQELKNIEDLNK